MSYTTPNESFKSPNDSFFICWQTMNGLEFIVYCEDQRWFMPNWVSPFRLGVLFRNDPTKRVWADA